MWCICFRPEDENGPVSLGALRNFEKSIRKEHQALRKEHQVLREELQELRDIVEVSCVRRHCF